MLKKMPARLSETNYSLPLIKPLFKNFSKVNISISLPYSSDFEGERISEKDLRVELGGSKCPSLELLTLKSAAEIEDGRVELIGPDIRETNPGDSLPLALIVDVYGRKMQQDFEPVFERQLHRFINYAQGITHSGQRGMNLIRVSNKAYERGFSLKEIGVILHTMLHKEYGAILDKVQVRLYTRKEDVNNLLVEAKKVFGRRDERVRGMSDESVDTYYSCLICQSLTPNHVCVITPERTGICGAYSWLDAKASFEITPSGPNQPILKGEVLDQRLGQWDSVNDFVYSNSGKRIKKVSLYSLIDSPQTSCGYFECIIVIIPEVNGVMIVDRNYLGPTPSGMDFSTLIGLMERGAQTPGFLGASKLYLLSKKFISAEGGLKRVVWMPKELKNFLKNELAKAAKDIGAADLLEKIADEETAVNLGELYNFAKKVKHPALSMEPLL
jgi:acetyl-CoA synthase